MHSYLDQMLEKLVLCRELLADTGSVFVQIGDENVHRLALVLDEVFGAENRIATIPYVTAGHRRRIRCPAVADFLLWYAKDKPQAKYHQIYEAGRPAGAAANVDLGSPVGATRRYDQDPHTR